MYAVFHYHKQKVVWKQVYPRQSLKAVLDRSCCRRHLQNVFAPQRTPPGVSCAAAPQPLRAGWGGGVRGRGWQGLHVGIRKGSSHSHAHQVKSFCGYLCQWEDWTPGRRKHSSREGSGRGARNKVRSWRWWNPLPLPPSTFGCVSPAARQGWLGLRGAA
eukprot:gene17731-biopygen18909